MTTVTVAVAALWGATFSPASANSQLVGASPADGEVLRASPRDVKLTFSQRLRARPHNIALSPEGQDPIPLPQPTIAGVELRQQLPSKIASGRYVLSWTAQSFDGHPTTGRITFTVGAGSASPVPTGASSPSKEYDPANPRATEPPRNESTQSWIPALVLFVLVLLLGAIGWTIIRDSNN